MQWYSFLIGFMFMFTSCVASPQTTKKIYELPENVETTVETAKPGSVIAGSNSGLYRLTSTKTAIPLWTEGKVLKIIHTNASSIVQGEIATTDLTERWYFLTSKGILTSEDLKTFEFRNNGLPFLKMKDVSGEQISFSTKQAQLKDLEIHPENPNILITATKDNVYITYDGGLNWSSIGSMSRATSGIKAVAVCTLQNKLVAFMSHPIFGFSYSILQNQKNVWVDCNGGFENLTTQTYPDEIADIIPVVKVSETGEKAVEIYVSQTFLPRIYRFNFETKRAELLYSGKEKTDTIDGLFWDGEEILFSRPGEIASFDPKTNALGTIPESYYDWKDSFDALSPLDTLFCAWIADDKDLNKGLSLSELWLLKPQVTANQYASKALNRKAIYSPSHHLATQAGIEKYKKIILENKLDSIVIDMKDDYGLLRFDAKDPVVVEKGYVSKYHIDLKNFVAEMKKDNIYLIARIVVFKDKKLSEYAGGKYAVWDKTTNKPWIGTKGKEKVFDENGNEIGEQMAYYDENWVDPYSPEVWDYNVRIAKELIEGGFDEIQFDYIRFPTDGRNMANATFRWKDKGMDKESALLSFLAYARKHIDAPIGIDIYGANGWYRSGTRTGQDVEQLSEYVDVICPMFYPSHFEQNFLEYAPTSERPYRIYYYGTYRNTVIGRNKIIIRPWVQAFYLNVRYDRQWYNKNYVQQQIFGIRDSVDRGYMYWNNIGRYDDISPDIGNAPYTGPAEEAKSEYRKPALGDGNLLYPKTLQKKIEISPALQQSSQNEQLEAIRTENKTGKFPSISDLKKLWQAYDYDKQQI